MAYNVLIVEFDFKINCPKMSINVPEFKPDLGKLEGDFAAMEKSAKPDLENLAGEIEKIFTRESSDLENTYRQMKESLAGRGGDRAFAARMVYLNEWKERSLHKLLSLKDSFNQRLSDLEKRRSAVLAESGKTVTGSVKAAVLAGRPEKVEGVEEIPKPQDCVLIGDSQAEGLKLGGLNEMGVNIHDFRGKTAAFLLAWIKKHPRALSGKKVVSIQVGGNEISNGRNFEYIKAGIVKLVDYIRGAFPNIRKIVLGDVPVRGQWFDWKAKEKPGYARKAEGNLNLVNKWIAAGGDGRFSYFPLNKFVADPNNPRYQRADLASSRPDMHLTAKGYRGAARYFYKTFFKEEPPLKS